MRNLIFRLFLLAIAGFTAFYYVFPWAAYDIKVPFSGTEYKLGLDLQGGIELDYKVDLDEVRKESDYNKTKEQTIIEGLKSIIDKRIESLNISDSVLSSASYGGEQHIIVQIPMKGNDNLENSKNIERAKEAIGRVVKITFKEKRESITDADKQARLVIADNLLSELKASKYDFFVTANKYRDNYELVEVGTTPDLTKIFSGAINPTQVGLSQTILKVNFAGNIGSLITEKTKDNSYDYAFISDTPSEWMDAKDSQGRVLNDKYFTKSSVQFDQAFTPLVELTFNEQGAKIFGELTSRLVGKQIAIFVGGELLTAPNVNEAILNGKAVITGQKTAEEAKKLSNDINTGVVPAPIYLTSEKSIDSKLGSHSLGKLIYAGIIGFLLIFTFLIYIYRWSGFMSAIALLLYTIIVLVIVKASGVVLTLASIAGLILSIGMAIDANVLIFERMREEIKEGKTLVEASSIGFKKSFSAIWDAHITAILVSAILFIFGINMIKGFGLMLAIGIIVSLFSALYISRILVMLLAKTMKDKVRFLGK